MKQVLIGIPSGSDWKASFGMCLIPMVAQSASPPPEVGDYALGVENIRGSILPQLRRRVVQKALDIGATHVLFIDSDMTFPANLLHELLKAEKEIVAVNCVTKSLPANPTARLKGGFSGKPLHSESASERYSQVWRVGTGIMLIAIEVFKKIPAPWFPITWNEEHQEEVGEDWGFCSLAEEAGIPIWVDNELSMQVGHVGTLEYTVDFVQEESGIIL